MMVLAFRQGVGGILWNSTVRRGCSERILRRTTSPWKRTAVMGGQSRSFVSSKELIGWSIDPETKIGTLTLQSPETLNALTVEMGQVFEERVRQIRRDCHHPPDHKDPHSDLRAIVLTGEGKAFSAGGHVEWLNQLGSHPVHINADAMMQFYQSFLCVRGLPVPVIAALEGPAVGAGAGLALACDLRTARSPSSTKKQQPLLGFTFGRLGIHAGMGASHYLPRTGSLSTGMVNEILLTGKTLSAKEAFDYGLVNRVTDPNDSAATATELAVELALEIGKAHPVAVRGMVQTLRQQQDVGLEAALLREAAMQAACYARQDWGRGVEAAMQKQEASFDPYPSH